MQVCPESVILTEKDFIDIRDNLIAAFDKLVSNENSSEETPSREFTSAIAGAYKVINDISSFAPITLVGHNASCFESAKTAWGGFMAYEFGTGNNSNVSHASVLVKSYAESVSKALNLKTNVKRK